MNQARCLVLGGGGFLGSHIAERLLVEGHHVRIFDRFPQGRARIEHLCGDVEVMEGEFGRAEDVEAALRGVDCVFHYLGASLPQDSNQNPFFDIESNLVHIVMMLRTMTRTGVSRIVFASSGGTVYGIPRRLPITEDHPTDPLCSYGVTKLAVEKYLHVFHHLHGVDFRVLRYSNPFGERQNPWGSQGAIAVFLGRIARGQPIEVWGDGEVVRDFIYVKDAVEATMSVFKYEGESRVFNVGSGGGVTLRRLLEVLGKVTGVDSPVLYREGRKVDVPVNILDIARIREATGWRPKVSLEEGVASTWAWVRSELTSSAPYQLT